MDPDGKARFGNNIRVTWTVSGDPNACKYGQDERGSGISAVRADGKDSLLTGVGEDHPDLKAEGILFNFGTSTAEYVDFFGPKFAPGRAVGTWIISGRLDPRFYCQDSTGRGGKSRKVLIFEGHASFSGSAPRQ